MRLKAGEFLYHFIANKSKGNLELKPEMYFCYKHVKFLNTSVVVGFLEIAAHSVAQANLKFSQYSRQVSNSQHLPDLASYIRYLFL